MIIHTHPLGIYMQAEETDRIVEHLAPFGVIPKTCDRDHYGSSTFSHRCYEVLCTNRGKLPSLLLKFTGRSSNQNQDDLNMRESEGVSVDFNEYIVNYVSAIIKSSPV